MASHDEALEKVLAAILAEMGDTAGKAVGAIQANLQAGSVDGAISAIDWDAITRSLGGMTPNLQAAFVAAGIPGPMTALAMFEMVDARAVDWASRHAAVRIADITSEAKATVRQFIVEALQGGRTAPQTARLIREVVPLSPRHARTVASSYEARITDLLASGVKMSRAETMAERTANFTARRLRNSRARTIARTEIATAANVGRRASWEEGVNAGVYPDTMLKEWVTGVQACSVCDPEDGNRVGWRDTFRIVGVDMPPAHPNCRCAAMPVWPDEKDRRSAATGQAGDLYPEELDAIQQESEAATARTRAASNPAAQERKKLPTTGGAAYLSKTEGDTIASASMRLSRGELSRTEYRAIVDPIREKARRRV